GARGGKKFVSRANRKTEETRFSTDNKAVRQVTAGIANLGTAAAVAARCGPAATGNQPRGKGVTLRAGRSANRGCDMAMARLREHGSPIAGPWHARRSPWRERVARAAMPKTTSGSVPMPRLGDHPAGRAKSPRDRARSRFHALAALVAAAACLAASNGTAPAQTIDHNLWITNGA